MYLSHFCYFYLGNKKIQTLTRFSVPSRVKKMENKAYLADNQDITGDNHKEDDLPTYEQCMRKYKSFEVACLQHQTVFWVESLESEENWQNFPSGKIQFWKLHWLQDFAERILIFLNFCHVIIVGFKIIIWKFFTMKRF